MELDPTRPFNPDFDEQTEWANKAIQDAADLEFLTKQRGFSILLENFEERKQNAIDVLLAINPGDEKAILAAHAVAVAVSRTLDDLISGIDKAIQNREAAKAYLDAKQSPQFQFSDF